MVIIEFPEREKAKAFLSDPEIQDLFKVRHDTTTSKLGRWVHVALLPPSAARGALNVTRAARRRMGDRSRGRARALFPFRIHLGLPGFLERSPQASLPAQKSPGDAGAFEVIDQKISTSRRAERHPS
jgi:hypothetical protein